MWEYTKDLYYGNWKVWRSLTEDKYNIFHVQCKDEAVRLARLLNSFEFGEIPKHLLGEQ